MTPSPLTPRTSLSAAGPPMDVGTGRPARTAPARLRARTLFHQDLATVVLEGELDHDNAPVAERALEAALERDPLLLHLDLTRLTFCDCAGLDAVLPGLCRARHRGLVTGVYGTQTPVTRLLTLMGLDGQLNPLP